VITAYQRMAKTAYSQKTAVNEQARVYIFDSPGMANYFVGRAASGAAAALHAATKSTAPTPTQWAQFIQGKDGGLKAPWQRVTVGGRIQPGDFIALPAHGDFKGAVLIAAGTPLGLNDGSYALRVWDSTTSPHGPLDTRLSDPRVTNKAGLGNGTIRLYVNGQANITKADWSMDDSGPSLSGVPVVVGRAG
jgi:hypothetical protein